MTIHTHCYAQGIEADDMFTFNDEFTSKFKRIKVPLVSAKEVCDGNGNNGNSCMDGNNNSSGAGGEHGGSGSGGGGDGGSSIPEAVEEERRHHVEAAIVRIMKSRKTISHNELVMEATRQLSVRFTPTPLVSPVAN